MRTMHTLIDGVNYEVNEEGVIVRLPTEFRPTCKTLKPSVTKNGYLRLFLRGGSKFAHRIVFEAFNGPVPDGMVIDHINGVRTDNRICNLRLATRKENSLNRQSSNANNSSGVRGVYFHRSSGCWVFSVSGQQIMSSRDKQKTIDHAMEFHNGRA